MLLISEAREERKLTQRKNHSLERSDEKITDQTDPLDGFVLGVRVRRFPETKPKTDRETDPGSANDGEERVFLHGTASCRLFLDVIRGMHSIFGVLRHFLTKGALDTRHAVHAAHLAGHVRPRPVVVISGDIAA